MPPSKRPPTPNSKKPAGKKHATAKKTVPAKKTAAAKKRATTKPPPSAKKPTASEKPPAGKRAAAGAKRAAKNGHAKPAQPVTDDAVAARAYSLWLEEGCPDGRADEHWMRARRELEEAAAGL